jgi:hypothetical protein
LSLLLVGGGQVKIELRDVERDECLMEQKGVSLGEELGSVHPFELP